MPKRSSKPPADENVAAHSVMERIITKSDPESAPAKPHRKNPAAVALGRRGGLKGGKARAAALTPEERSQIARRAAETRWRPDE